MGIIKENYNPILGAMMGYRKYWNDLFGILPENYTGKMIIRIGEEVSLPADHCDWNNLQACSSGLNVAQLKSNL